MTSSATGCRNQLAGLPLQSTHRRSHALLVTSRVCTSLSNRTAEFCVLTGTCCKLSVDKPSPSVPARPVSDQTSLRSVYETRSGGGPERVSRIFMKEARKTCCPERGALTRAGAGLGSSSRRCGASMSTTTRGQGHQEVTKRLRSGGAAEPAHGCVDAWVGRCMVLTWHTCLGPGRLSFWGSVASPSGAGDRAQGATRVRPTTTNSDQQRPTATNDHTGDGH